MSGVFNINRISKKYDKAQIYFHKDADGVFSALTIKEYLKKYGIKTVKATPIQYGDDEYAVEKPDDNTLVVMVDFSHGKSFVDIHFDHHKQQFTFTHNHNFKPNKSNTDTINYYVDNKILNETDNKVVNIIDSADFYNNGLTFWDINNASFGYNKELSAVDNRLKFNLTVGKLILAYKNKPNYLSDMVMMCNPTFISVYNYIQKYIKENGLFNSEVIMENAKTYNETQAEKSLQSITCEEFCNKFETLADINGGQSILVNDKVIVQVGGGNTKMNGGFDRYTPYSIYPQAKYLIMIWNGIQMLQVSKNPFIKDDEDKDLGNILFKIYDNHQYGFKSKQISLLTLKKFFEKKCHSNSVGFCYNEMKKMMEISDDNIIERLGIKDELSADFIKMLKHNFNMKKYDFCNSTMSEEDNKKSVEIQKALNSIRISFYDVVKKLSGGHKDITNLSGVGLANLQQGIDKCLKGNINVYSPYKRDGEKNYDTFANNVLLTFSKEFLKELCNERKIYE